MKPFICLLLLLASVCAEAGVANKRVAMLISSYGSESAPELSYDLEELAQAYLVLHENGLQIDIVSPKGGPVLIKNNKDNLDYIQRFKAIALSQLNNTLPVSAVDGDQYDGIFIVGGGGAMIDLPEHEGTQELLTEFARRQGLITAVCHGPAAIADITLADGRYLVAGKQVNSFTNLEEHAFSKENIEKFPFLTEDRLRENGAIFVNNAPMLPYVAVDGHLITAQNPGSVAKAAEAMLVKLGLSPKPRKLFDDEATMALISEARTNGAALIDIALVTSADDYSLNYLALYGFYAYRLAADEDKPTELRLMRTIADYFEHPAYESNLIQALVEQQHIEEATERYQQFSQNYPEHDQVKALAGLFE